MTLNLEKYDKDVLFLPLGGSNEIGMNLNLYYHQGKWLMVDLGIGFAEKDFPGIDVILPKIDFIEDRKEDLVGLILTHAHEDHIGGVPYLWSYLRCPIYTTQFTAEVLRAKFAEFGITEDIEINIMDSNHKFDVGPFSVELIGITHSTPETHGVVIRTPAGNIFHTADWKLDPKPVVGEATDENRLQQIGDEGVLAMIGDSTNIFTKGKSGSEGDLSISLAKLIRECAKGLIIVTTFASNIARLYSIAKAAEQANKKVVLAGRALWRLYQAAINSGYLSDIQPFLQTRQIHDHKRDDILVICTGCQGEELAATGKLSRGEHPDITLDRGDTIIFASKIIPGNDKKIYQLFNRFCKMGVEVLTERDHFVHVSGHPARDEVARMYELIRPRVAVPVHGEPMHIHEHCSFAREKGIKYAVEVENGAIIHLNAETPHIIGKVDSGYLGVDGNYMVDEFSPILRDRLVMRDHGMILAIVLLGKGNRLIRARVLAPGLLDRYKDGDIFSAMNDAIKGDFAANRRRDERSVGKALSGILRKIARREKGKEPKVIIHIERVQ